MHSAAKVLFKTIITPKPRLSYVKFSFSRTYIVKMLNKLALFHFRSKPVSMFKNYYKLIDYFYYFAHLSIPLFLVLIHISINKCTNMLDKLVNSIQSIPFFKNYTNVLIGHIYLQYIHFYLFLSLYYTYIHAIIKYTLNIRILIRFILNRINALTRQFMHIQDIMFRLDLV